VSILNVWRDEQRLLLAVDTRAAVIDPDGALSRSAGLEPGQPLHVSKMLPLPAAHCVLAVRGSGVMPAAVFSACLGIPNAHFDLLRTAMLPVLAAGMAALRASPMAAPGNQLDAKQEVMLVGWSQRANAPGAAFYVKHVDSDHFVAMQGDDWASHAAPWDDAWGVLPDGDSHEAMLRLAREQVRLQRVATPGLPFGGRLLVAEITRKAITITEVCDDL